MLATAVVAGPAAAQGHGPIYGLSTPTLGRGGWSLDVGGMARLLEGQRMLMGRPMVSYGVTEDLQVSGSVPVVIERGEAPSWRALTRMSAARDVELGLGWRFQRRGTGVGSRQETTAWAAWVQPLEDRRDGVPTSAGGFGALVTGYASRTVYGWVGGAYRRYAGRGGSRAGDVAMASLVLGYRPGLFREDYPEPDWRGFVEVVAEWKDKDKVAGEVVGASGGQQLFVALTVLGLYGSWGIAGGPAFPVLQDLAGDQLEDRLRFAINLTFWW